MRQNKLLDYILLIAALGMLTMVIINSVTVVTDIAYSSDEIDNQGRNLKIKAFEKINRALESKGETRNFVFSGTVSSPFRPLSTQGVGRRKTGKTVKTVYKTLFLKGTLIKEGALAIIEDEDGKTFICRQGEKVHNRLIVKVGEDEVTIKDDNGTTVLKVRE
jgi:hypothetical protein